MKHNKKVNPLTHFNNLKGEAIKKGNQQLANYKKSLKKFQGNMDGSQVASAASDSINKINMSNNVYNTELANARKLMEEAYKKADLEERNKQAVKALNNSVVPTPGSNIPSSTKPSIQGAYDEYKAFQMSKSKKGGSVKKMSKGGALKPVPSDKVGLSKLPTPVRNKMGYQKKGGSVKRK